MNEFMAVLGKYRKILTCQQIATLKGQALSGNEDAARRGLAKILRRLETDAQNGETEKRV